MTYLEGQLQLRAGDDNVGKIQQVDLQRVQHTLPTHNDALGLLLHGKRAHQSSHLNVSHQQFQAQQCCWPTAGSAWPPLQGVGSFVVSNMNSGMPAFAVTKQGKQRPQGHGPRNNSTPQQRKQQK